MCDIHPKAHVITWPKARLPHRCYSCGGTIMPGEVYQQDSGAWDGRGASFRRHELCVLLEQRLADDEGCVEFGMLNEAPQIMEEPDATYRTAWEAVMGRAWPTNRWLLQDAP